MGGFTQQGTGERIGMGDCTNVSHYLRRLPLSIGHVHSQVTIGIDEKIEMGDCIFVKSKLSPQPTLYTVWPHF
jgi:hypothetical protein